MSKVRIKLKTMNIEQLNDICNQIKEIALKAGITVSGPIPLPTRKLKITTRKSTDYRCAGDLFFLGS